MCKTSPCISTVFERMSALDIRMFTSYQTLPLHSLSNSFSAKPSLTPDPIDWSPMHCISIFDTELAFYIIALPDNNFSTIPCTYTISIDVVAGIYSLAEIC